MSMIPDIRNWLHHQGAVNQVAQQQSAAPPQEEAPQSVDAEEIFQADNEAIKNQFVAMASAAPPHHKKLLGDAFNWTPDRIREKSAAMREQAAKMLKDAAAATDGRNRMDQSVVDRASYFEDQANALDQFTPFAEETSPFRSGKLLDSDANYKRKYEQNRVALHAQGRLDKNLEDTSPMDHDLRGPEALKARDSVYIAGGPEAMAKWDELSKKHFQTFDIDKASYPGEAPPEPSYQNPYHALDPNQGAHSYESRSEMTPENQAKKRKWLSDKAEWERKYHRYLGLKGLENHRKAMLLAGKVEDAATMDSILDLTRNGDPKATEAAMKIGAELRKDIEEREAMAQQIRDEQYANMPLTDKIQFAAQRTAQVFLETPRQVYALTQGLLSKADGKPYNQMTDPVYQDSVLSGGGALDEVRNHLDSSAAAGQTADVIGQVVGSQVAFMMGGWAAKAFTSSRMLQLAGIGTIGAGVSYDNLFREAKQHGASDDEANNLIFWSLASGGIEGLPIQRLMKTGSKAAKVMQKIDKASGGKLAKSLRGMTDSFVRLGVEAGKEAIEEGLQEGIQSLIENHGAQVIFDEFHELDEGLAESVSLGAAFGGTMSLLLGSLGRVRNRLFPGKESPAAAIIDAALRDSVAKASQQTGNGQSPPPVDEATSTTSTSQGQENTEGSSSTVAGGSSSVNAAAAVKARVEAEQKAKALADAADAAAKAGLSEEQVEAIREAARQATPAPAEEALSDLRSQRAGEGQKAKDLKDAAREAAPAREPAPKLTPIQQEAEDLAAEDDGVVKAPARLSPRPAATDSDVILPFEQLLDEVGGEFESIEPQGQTQSSSAPRSPVGVIRGSGGQVAGEIYERESDAVKAAELSRGIFAPPRQTTQNGKPVFVNLRQEQQQPTDAILPVREAFGDAAINRMLADAPGTTEVELQNLYSKGIIKPDTQQRKPSNEKQQKQSNEPLLQQQQNKVQRQPQAQQQQGGQDQQGRVQEVKPVRRSSTPPENYFESSQARADAQGKLRDLGWPQTMIDRMDAGSLARAAADGRKPPTSASDYFSTMDSRPAPGLTKEGAVKAKREQRQQNRQAQKTFYDQVWDNLAATPELAGATVERSRTTPSKGRVIMEDGTQIDIDIASPQEMLDAAIEAVSTDKGARDVANSFYREGNEELLAEALRADPSMPATIEAFMALSPQGRAEVLIRHGDAQGNFNVISLAGKKGGRISLVSKDKETISHELFHAVIHLALDKRQVAALKRAYKGDNWEENAVNGYTSFLKEGRPKKGLINRIFDRIATFLDKMGLFNQRAARVMADSIFDAVAKGQGFAVRGKPGRRSTATAVTEESIAESAKFNAAPGRNFLDNIFESEAKKTWVRATDLDTGEVIESPKNELKDNLKEDHRYTFRSIEPPQAKFKIDITKQTSTENFKTWFGKSKAVAPDDSPLVAYHGTDIGGGFTMFKRADHRGRKDYVNPLNAGELGSWFSAPARSMMDHYMEYAEMSAYETADMMVYRPGGKGTAGGEYNKTARIYPVFLAIENPATYYSYEEMIADASANGLTNAKEMVATGRGPWHYLREWLIKQGYDGVHLIDSDTDGGEIRDDWVAFHPWQIKSAIGNSGAFSRSNDDIRYNVKPKGPDADLVARAASRHNSRKMIDSGMKPGPMPTVTPILSPKRIKIADDLMLKKFGKADYLDKAAFINQYGVLIKRDDAGYAHVEMIDDLVNATKALGLSRSEGNPGRMIANFESVLASTGAIRFYRFTGTARKDVGMEIWKNPSTSQIKRIREAGDGVDVMHLDIHDPRTGEHVDQLVVEPVDERNINNALARITAIYSRPPKGIVNNNATPDRFNIVPWTPPRDMNDLLMYSPSMRAVDAMKFPEETRIKGDQFLATLGIKTEGGVAVSSSKIKLAEVQLTGLVDFVMRQEDGKVSKKDALDYLARYKSLLVHGYPISENKQREPYSPGQNTPAMVRRHAVPGIPEPVTLDDISWSSDTIEPSEYEIDDYAASMAEEEKKHLLENRLEDYLETGRSVIVNDEGIIIDSAGVPYALDEVDGSLQDNIDDNEYGTNLLDIIEGFELPAAIMNPALENSEVSLDDGYVYAVTQKTGSTEGYRKRDILDHEGGVLFASEDDAKRFAKNKNAGMPDDATPRWVVKEVPIIDMSKLEEDANSSAYESARQSLWEEAGEEHTSDELSGYRIVEQHYEITLYDPHGNEVTVPRRTGRRDISDYQEAALRDAAENNLIREAFDEDQYGDNVPTVQDLAEIATDELFSDLAAHPGRAWNPYKVLMSLDEATSVIDKFVNRTDVDLPGWTLQEAIEAQLVEYAPFADANNTTTPAYRIVPPGKTYSTLTIEDYRGMFTPRSHFDAELLTVTGEMLEAAERTRLGIEAAEPEKPKRLTGPVPGSEPDRTSKFGNWMKDLVSALGGNYQEHFLTLDPTALPDSLKPSEAFTYRSHFNEGNIIAHMLTADMKTPEGDKLFMIEGQSDWHQQGLDKGYAPPKEVRQKIDQIYDDTITPFERANRMAVDGSMTKEEIKGVASAKVSDEEIDAYLSAYGEVKALREKHPQWEAPVPFAPFKENWHDILVGRLITLAAQRGMSGVAIADGELAARRWGTELVSWIRVDEAQKKWDELRAKYPDRDSAGLDPSTEGLTGIDMSTVTDAADQAMLKLLDFKEDNNQSGAVYRMAESEEEAKSTWILIGTSQRGGNVIGADGNPINIEQLAIDRGQIPRDYQKHAVKNLEDVTRFLRNRKIDDSGEAKIAAGKTTSDKVWERMQKNQAEGSFMPRHEGMTYFYNNMLRKALEKKAKELGGKVVATAHPTAGWNPDTGKYEKEISGNPAAKESPVKYFELDFTPEIVEKIQSRGVSAWNIKPKTSLQGNLTAATQSISGINKLLERSISGEESATRIINNVTTTHLEWLMGGLRTAVLMARKGYGIFGGHYEPSIDAIVNVDNSETRGVIAAFAGIGRGYKQQETHALSEQPTEKSIAVPFFSWSLTSPASRSMVKDILENTGAYGLSAKGSTISSYYPGVFENEAEKQGFLDTIKNITAYLGSRSGQVLQGTRHLEIYGPRHIPYESVAGDLRPGSPQAWETQQRQLRRQLEGQGLTREEVDAILRPIRFNVAPRSTKTGVPHGEQAGIEQQKTASQNRSREGASPAGSFRIPSDVGRRFRGNLAIAAASQRFGKAVEVKDESFYLDPSNKLYGNADITAGAAVTAAGDLVSVFKMKGASSEDIRSVLDEASQEARTLDGYDINGMLPNMYGSFGFRPAARIKFNREFAPEGWPYGTAGEPDIVLMVRDVDGSSGLPKIDANYNEIKDTIPLFTSYDDALAHRDKAIARIRFNITPKRAGDKSRQAVDERPGQRTIGRPQIANPVFEGADGSLTPEQADQARNVARAAQEIAREEGRPQRRADEDVFNEAKARLARRDHAKEEKRIFQRDQATMSMSDTDVLIARTLISNKAMEALREDSDEKFLEAVDMNMIYEETGTNMARAFRMRRDFVQSPQERMRDYMIEALTTPTHSIRDKARKLRESAAKETDQKERDKKLERRQAMLRKYAKKLRDIRDRLRKRGIDPTAMTDEDMSDPRKVTRAIREIQAAKADNWDRMYEYWINMVLSGIPTHIRNIAGNSAFSFWEMTAQKMTEGVVNAILPGDRTDATMLGELKYAYAGIMDGVSRGWSNAMMAFDTETPVFADSFSGSKIEAADRSKAIPGKLGRAIRMPTRFLLAEDEMFKGVLARMEVAGFAYREARKLGHKGQQLQSYIADQINDPTSESWTQAKERAKYMTWQQAVGPNIQKYVMGVRRDIPGARYIIPFVTTPYNIFKTGMRKSPLGTVNILVKSLKSAWNGDSYVYPRRDVVRDIAEQIWAWGLTTMLMGWAAPDDEGLPLITGSAPRDPGVRGIAYDETPPMSIRVGGKWLSYKFIEPFAVTLAVAVDGINSIRKAQNGQEAAKTMAEIQDTLVSQLTDKTFLRGLSDIERAVRGTGGHPLVSWASNFSSSWVPNVFKSATREGDDEIAETKIWQADSFSKPFWDRAAHVTAYKMAPGLVEIPAKVTLWGERVTKHEGGSPATDWLYRMIVPVNQRDVKVSKGSHLNRFILNWNEKFPFDQIRPFTPPPVITYQDRRYEMSPELYEQFLIDRGSTALGVLKNVKLDYDNPQPKHRGMIKEALSDAEEYAEHKIVRNAKDLIGKGDLRDISQRRVE